MATCNINTLIAQGACFQCYDDKQVAMATLQLLCDISQSSGGGGTQRVFHGPSDPNGSQVGPDPSIYYGDDGSLWVKTNGSTDDTGWEPLIQGFTEAPNALARSFEPDTMEIKAMQMADLEMPALPAIVLSPPRVPPPLPKPVISKSFMSKVKSWVSMNLFSWFLFMLMFVLPASAAVPPPLVRNQMTTNEIIVGAGGIMISTIPGTTTITGSGGGGGGSVTGGTNIGSGVGIFSGTNGGLLFFKSFSTIPTNVASFWFTNGTDIIFFEQTNYVAGGAGGSGDIVSMLQSNIVYLSGGTNLGATAFGAIHFLYGSTNYQVELPSPTGNARKLIGIYIMPSYTNLVTITNSGLIDGATARFMWAGETAVLLCDGTNYVKIAGKTISMSCSAKYGIGSVNQFTYLMNVNGSIPVDVPVTDPSFLFSAPDSAIKIKRPGVYVVNNFITAGENLVPLLLWQSLISVNGTTPYAGTTTEPISYNGGVNYVIQLQVIRSIALLPGDLVQVGYFTGDTGKKSRAIDGFEPTVLLYEIPSW